ncbi:MAG: hypothetical protein ACREIB_06520 [Pseudomonadota bacterium]
MAIIEISHSCDGSVELVCRVRRAGVAEPDRVFTSGDGAKIPLRADTEIEVSFRPYPTPIGNEPHGLEASTQVTALLQRRFGREAIAVEGGAATVIADDQPAAVAFPREAKLIVKLAA